MCNIEQELRTAEFASGSELQLNGTGKQNNAVLPQINIQVLGEVFVSHSQPLPVAFQHWASKSVLHRGRI